MNKFNDLVSALFRRVAAKKIFLYTLTVFLIVLPVSIALVIVSAPSNAKTSESTITVTLKELDGNEIAREITSSRELGGDSLASIINNLNEGKSRAEELPAFDASTKPLVAIIESENERTELVCYFSLNGNDSYCTDESGEVYMISRLDATDFLTSKYSEILYSSATLPILKTIDGEAVLPRSLDWNYKNVSETFVKASDSALGGTDDEYSITGQIDIEFSIKPSSCQASVYGIGGDEIFNGTIDGIKNLIVSASDSVRVIIDAYWEKNDLSSYYGSAHYDFNVIIANKSEFSVSSTVLAKDGFVLLKATNIEDLSKIQFQSDQSAQAPEFIFVGTNLAEAILTYPTDISSTATTFDFSVSYRASMERFTLDLSKASTAPEYYSDIPCPSFAASLAKNFASEMRYQLNIINGKSATSRYNAYNPSFLSLSECGFSKNIDYGSHVFYSDTNVRTFVSSGCEFSADSYGISVPAVNAGIVVAVGEDDHLGKFVVIDHGMGLNVWYCNLSDIDVKERAPVTKEQSIGKTARSEVSQKEGFWIYVTFKDKILDPNEIIK